jgi:hypothetical protein
MTLFDPLATLGAFGLLLMGGLSAVLAWRGGVAATGLIVCGVGVCAGVGLVGFGAKAAGIAALLGTGPLLAVLWLGASAHMGARRKPEAPPRLAWRLIAVGAASALAIGLIAGALSMPALGAGANAGGASVLPLDLAALAGMFAVIATGAWMLLSVEAGQR